MKNSWTDYVIPVVACVVFPVLIPVALGLIAYGMIAAANKASKEAKDVD